MGVAEDGVCAAAESDSLRLDSIKSKKQNVEIRVGRHLFWGSRIA